MNTKHLSMMIHIVILSIFISSCGPGQLFGPTFTPTTTLTPTSTPTSTPTLTSTATLTPTSTFTPTPEPHPAFVVIEAAISGDAFGIVIEDKDTNGNMLDVLTVGLDCLDQVFYIQDETGARLECTNVTTETDEPNRIGMIFTGASSEHHYQLVIPGVPPIDLEPRQVN